MEYPEAYVESELLISIIMPAFNRQETISFAIESILQQTYGNFELILVDDASEDATCEVMDFYRSLDCRIKVVRNERNSRNSPIQWEPRNDGLKYADGVLIAYLDSDNLWHPEFLKVLSAPFLQDPTLQLVHCNSRNHYADRQQYELVLREDARKLIEKNDADLTAIYSYSDTGSADSGIGWYIDTNEMMHRAGIFGDIGYLWVTWHPKRKSINDSQCVKRTHRRHNDQELAERIMRRYGASSVKRIDDVLVEFFYAQRQGRFIEIMHPGITSRIIDRKPLRTFPPQLYDRAVLNIDFFYKEHLVGKKDTQERKKYDFGVGEFAGDFVAEIQESFEQYTAGRSATSRLIRYGGTTSLGAAIENIAQDYRNRGLENIDQYAITPCDGGHNALFHSFQCLIKNQGRDEQTKNMIVFMVPSYPYWTICAAAGASYEAVEAYDFDEYIRKLSGLPQGKVAAIVINTPHNPLGISITKSQVGEINALAKRYNCGIIVDMPYHTFLPGDTPLATFALFDAERTIFCDSVSKSLALPGLRLGFAFSENQEISALIRSHKSASSLLPSSIKLDYVDQLQKARPTFKQKITDLALGRRRRVRNYLNSAELPKGIKWKDTENHTIYDLLYIDVNSQWHSKSDHEISQLLYNDHDVQVTMGEKMFSPGHVRSHHDKIIRISCAKTEEIEEGLDALMRGLKAVTKTDKMRRA